MKRVIVLLCALLCASAAFSSIQAAAGVLKCVCPGGPKCQLQKGREQVDFMYDPQNMAAYDALEAQAMREADEKAADAAAEAQAKYAGLMCPLPCGPAGTMTSHGKPFAGGTNGHGIARSRWEVDYICAKVVPPPPPPKPIAPGPRVAPPPPPPPPPPPEEGTTSPGGSKWHIDVPKVPKCFGLPVDKDDFLDELRELRSRAAVNLPLGTEKDDPDWIEAMQQRDINLANIDAAIDQA